MIVERRLHWPVVPRTRRLSWNWLKWIWIDKILLQRYSPIWLRCLRNISILTCRLVTSTRPIHWVLWIILLLLVEIFTSLHPARFRHLRTTHIWLIKHLIIAIVLTFLRSPSRHVLGILLEIRSGRLIILDTPPFLVASLRLVVESIHFLD